MNERQKLLRLQLIVVAAVHVYMRFACGVGKFYAYIYAHRVKRVNIVYYLLIQLYRYLKSKSF